MKELWLELRLELSLGKVGVERVVLILEAGPVVGVGFRVCAGTGTLKIQG